MPATPVDNRHERRKAATKAAIVRAARELLVEEGPEISVQAIADRADVALGSFYNHFEGKQAVFAAAATDTLADFETSLLERSAHVEDPLELLVARMRWYGRMGDTHPETAKVMMHLPPSPELAPHGYSLTALADVEGAIASRGLQADDLDIRLIATVGALRHLVVLRDRDPSIGPERVDDLIAVLLGLFGVPAATASALAHAPLV